MIAACTSVDETSPPHRPDCRKSPTYAHTTSRTKLGLWRQPSLANVTCAWSLRLCGINPATACSYLTTMILPYDHPTYSLVLRFSLRSQSSRGRKYSLMWLPFSLVSPVAKYSASVHGIDDPSFIMSLQQNIQTYTQSVVQLQHCSVHKACTCCWVTGQATVQFVHFVWICKILNSAGCWTVTHEHYRQETAANKFNSCLIAVCKQ